MHFAHHRQARLVYGILLLPIISVTWHVIIFIMHFAAIYRYLGKRHHPEWSLVIAFSDTFRKNFLPLRNAHSSYICAFLMLQKWCGSEKVWEEAPCSRVKKGTRTIHGKSLMVLYAWYRDHRESLTMAMRACQANLWPSNIQNLTNRDGSGHLVNSHFSLPGDNKDE